MIRIVIGRNRTPVWSGDRCSMFCMYSVMKKKVANIENVTRNATTLPALNVRLRKKPMSSIGSRPRSWSVMNATTPTTPIANSARIRPDVQP